MVGRKFGWLTVIKEVTPKFYSTSKRKHGHRQWNCKCDCGISKNILGINLVRGLSRSCGCRRKLKSVDISNKKFGRLTAVSATSLRSHNGSCIWYCICDCGKNKNVSQDDLKKANVRSCGCLHHEVARLKGEKSHAWNPNLTDQDRVSERNILKWRDVKSFVKKRDSFTCLICGEHSGFLHAHHLLSWKIYPDKRLDSNNCITLCIQCHRDVHAIKRMVS